MGTIRLGVGTEWLQDGRAFRVVRQLGPDQFVTLDVKVQVEQVLSQSDLLNQFTLPVCFAPSCSKRIGNS